MRAVDVQEQAQKIFAAKGGMAIAEAAQMAVRRERDGREEEARDWRRIEAALSLMAGPRAK
jgi:hypothetical protein